MLSPAPSTDLPDVQRLLAAYLVQGSYAVEGWVDRITALDGVADEALSRAHGKLIALGWVDFDMLPQGGLRYRVTPQGRAPGQILPEAEVDDLAA